MKSISNESKSQINEELYLFFFVVLIIDR